MHDFLATSNKKYGYYIQARLSPLSDVLLRWDLLCARKVLSLTGKPSIVTLKGCKRSSLTLYLVFPNYERGPVTHRETFYCDSSLKVSHFTCVCWCKRDTQEIQKSWELWTAAWCRHIVVCDSLPLLTSATFRALLLQPLIELHCLQFLEHYFPCCAQIVKLYVMLLLEEGLMVRNEVGSCHKLPSAITKEVLPSNLVLPPTSFVIKIHKTWLYSCTRTYFANTVYFNTFVLSLNYEIRITLIHVKPVFPKDEDWLKLCRDR